MKKLFILILLLLAISTLFSSLAFANSGSASIPMYSSNGTTVETYIFVSNITGSTINVKVTLYDATGAMLTGPNATSNVNTGLTDFANNVTDCTVSFKLSPNQSGSFIVKAPNTTVGANGYGIIQWDQPGSSNIRGMLAHAAVIWQNFDLPDHVGRYAVPINQGLPF